MSLLENRLISRILNSRKPMMVLFRHLVIIILLVNGIISIKLIIQSLSYPYLYQKDIMQEYLLGRAILDGINPYIPLPDLASKYIGADSSSILILFHPTPHPPPIILLSLIFGFVDYQVATFLWLLLEVSCLLLTVYLILDWLDIGSPVRMTLIVTILLLGWEPLMFELVYGQLGTILLLLSVSSWLLLRRNNQLLGSIIFGLLLSLKLIGWPILIFFIVKKMWKLVIAIIGTFIFANVLTGVIIGFDRVIEYYVHIGGQVASMYRADSHNFSLWSIGWRVFDGTGSQVISGIEAPPLIAAPKVALIVSIFIPLAFLIICLIITYYMNNFDLSFAVMLCVSLLVNPVTWVHYLILAFLPLIIFAKHIFSYKPPKTEIIGLITITFLLLLSRIQVDKLAYLLTGQSDKINSSVQVPFLISLVTMFPLLPVLGLIWLGLRISKVCAQDRQGSLCG